MNLSHVAAAIYTSQLIEPFASDDLTLFKQELFKQYHIENEKQFISKFLLFSTKFIHHDVVSKVQQAATQISSKSEYAVTKPHDQVSSLPNDIIGKIGTFVTKKECINLGYTNRHLYIATQSKSFINTVNECNIIEGTMTFDHTIMTTLNVTNITGYGYYFPSTIILDGEKLTTINIKDETTQPVLKMPIKQDFFNNLFCSVQRLQIKGVRLAPYIPMCVLFNKNVHKNKLNVLQICKCFQTPLFSHWGEYFKQFIENYKDYLKNECDNNINNIRRIKRLEISTEENNDDELQLELHNIFDALNGTFEELKIQGCQFKNVNYNCLMSKVFHSNLKTISMQQLTLPIEFIKEIKNRIGDGDGNEKNSKQNAKSKKRQFQDPKKELETDKNIVSRGNNCDCKLANVEIDFLPPSGGMYGNDGWVAAGWSSAAEQRRQEKDMLMIWNVLSFYGIIDDITSLTLKFYSTDIIKRTFTTDNHEWAQDVIGKKNLKSLRMLNIELTNEDKNRRYFDLATGMTEHLFKQVFQSGVLKKYTSLKQITIKWQFCKTQKTIQGGWRDHI